MNSNFNHKLNSAGSSALLIIDVQKGFDNPHWGEERSNPFAEKNISLLLKAFRDMGPDHIVIHVRHDSTELDSPLRPGQVGNDFMDVVEPYPGERVFAKTVNSAFITTNLHEHLQSLGVNELVICGLTTDHCVSTTVRMAANLGYNVTLPGDATATFNRKGKDGRHLSAEEVHEFALASLDGEFARVIETREFLGALSHAI